VNICEEQLMDRP